MLELYHDPISANSQKVRLVLAELRVEWADRKIGLLAGEQHDPAYRRINPRGEVPTLVDGSFALSESAAINEYLADLHPDSDIRPASPQARAHMRHWIQRITDQLNEGCGVLSYAVAVRPLQLAERREEVLARIASMPDRAKRAVRLAVFEHGIEAESFARGLNQHVGMLANVEARLGESDWMAGSTYTLADATLFPYVLRLDHLAMSALWADLPNVTRWLARCRERESYRIAIEAHAPPGLVEMTTQAGQAVWPQVAAMIEPAEGSTSDRSAG
jgi:glutathione S-transferase